MSLAALGSAGLAGALHGALHGGRAVWRGGPAGAKFPEAVRDDDHVPAIFGQRGHWGAIAKSNYSGLRFREPVLPHTAGTASVYYNLSGYACIRVRRICGAWIRWGGSRSNHVDARLQMGRLGGGRSAGLALWLGSNHSDRCWHKSRWGRAIRKGDAEMPGCGGHGAVGCPQLRLLYQGRREEMHIDPTETAAPKTPGFQQMTDLRL